MSGARLKRWIWLPIAGFLLIAGAAIAAAAAAPSVTPVAHTSLDAASPAPSAAASPSMGDDHNGGPGHPGFGFGFGPHVAGAGADLLDQVLSDLVKAGTITQAQSDAITNGLKQAITDKQAQAEQLRQQAMQEWQQIQGFMSDGVITQDEVNQLPADSPFRQVFDSIAKDGQVTLDQLKQLRLFGPGAMGPGGHPGYGPGGPHHNPPASPSATGTSS